jgi:hypothetical protein
MVCYENGIFRCRKTKFTGTWGKIVKFVPRIYCFVKRKEGSKFMLHIWSLYLEIPRIYYFVKRKGRSKFVLHIWSLYLEIPRIYYFVKRKRRSKFVLHIWSLYLEIPRIYYFVKRKGRSEFSVEYTNTAGSFRVMKTKFIYWRFIDLEISCSLAFAIFCLHGGLKVESLLVFNMLLLLSGYFCVTRKFRYSFKLLVAIS